MKVTQTALPGVLVIEPALFGDHRGFFQETYSQQRYQDAGIAPVFVQDNHSRSSKGVLRGLHFQLNRPQGKLVRVVTGEVFDVAVDIRRGSPTFGQAAWVTLSGENHLQFYVPPGFAHGFCVLSEVADFEYKCTDYYYPEEEGGVIWSDPALQIPWPLEEPKLADKDRLYPCLSDIAADQLPTYSQ
ncbi:MAG: dTDP-4-dehydrorhamnose 3,5-epimerase [Gammaproteobacteria bacterium]|jgi:dTDP-4-dehydrorhamnose 3,5-epimerase|nr:dTDP-4-dehydrorhamnose 3,5-epimerase [Gammaproteobacteria bacterium]